MTESGDVRRVGVVVFLSLILVSHDVLAKVKASDFGFDESDATVCLQTAIDSGAAEVVVDRQRTPWRISHTLNGRSNQRIVFEKGVELVAIPGKGFWNGGDGLFMFGDCTNVVLSGYGARISMDRKTFSTAPYVASQHRHAFTVFDCRDFVMEGLEINGAGGDCIYVGAGNGRAGTNITLRDLVVSNGRRQGLSVTSAENLTIERCMFRDTAGTAPAAGIDFEPNYSGHRLVNVTVGDCIFENNACAGLEFALNHLSSKSVPLSIRVFGCRMSGNAVQFKFGTINTEDGDVGGSIDVRDCVFDASGRGSCYTLFSSGGNAASMSFEGCRVRAGGEKEFKPLLEKDWRRAITAPVFINGQVQILDVPADYGKATAIDERPGELVRFPELLSRYGISLVFHAASEGEVRLLLRNAKFMNRGVLPLAPISVLTLDGRKVTEAPAPGVSVSETVFRVPAAGWYRLKGHTDAYAFFGLSGSTVPIAFDADVSLFRPTCRLYFEMPDAKVPAALRFGGGGTKREVMAFGITAPSGTCAWRGDPVGLAHRYRFLPGRETGLWRLDFSESHAEGTYFEDAGVSALGIPSVFFPCREKRWTWMR